MSLKCRAIGFVVRRLRTRRRSCAVSSHQSKVGSWKARALSSATMSPSPVMMMMMMMMMMMFFFSGEGLNAERWHGLWVGARGFYADDPKPLSSHTEATHSIDGSSEF